MIDQDMCSPTTRKMREKRYNGKHVKCSQKKLAPNLFPKKKYICHIASLKQYLELGGVIDKVHRVLEFKQSNWLAEYIQYNTSKRQAATSDFKRAFFKLMVISSRIIYISSTIYFSGNKFITSRLIAHIINRW